MTDWQTPDEDETPFSLPRDMPELMPIDYPGLDSELDPQEAYDEGRDDILSADPYRPDDDPVRSIRRVMRANNAGGLFYTVNHDVIINWAEDRGGRPAHIAGEDNGLTKGGLFIYFEDEKPVIDIEETSWEEFFKRFERNRLVFVYRRATRSGAESRFYEFLGRREVGRLTRARPEA